GETIVTRPLTMVVSLKCLGPCPTVDKDSTVLKVPEEPHLYVDGADDNKNHNNNTNDDVVNIDVLQNKHLPQKPHNSWSQKYSPKCDVSAKEVSSAVKRAKTWQCKQEIADVYCQQQEGKLYNLDLTNYCPNRGKDKGHYYGCYKDSNSQRALDGGFVDLPDNSPQKCIEHCYRSGQKYAGLQYGKECWCGSSYGKHGSKLEEAHCFTKCPGNASETCGAYLTNKIYGTGVQAVIRHNAPLEHAHLNKTTLRIKIVFVLTVSGRAVRQVARLLRIIYSPDHFYYIHVDKRQEYMYRELLPLEQCFSNVMLTRHRFSTIWGGASLLQAHLSFLRELFDDKPAWNWDYYINLSESDYPIKSLSQLVDFLTAYKGLNFLRSFGKNVPRFIKKQGMDQTFHECENHLWRVSERPLPRGIVFDGGSDWIGLWWEFAHYSLYSKDPLVTGLKQYYKYSLLPVESFFHMVLQNSVFCTQSVDNNLHLTNWRRKQGCKCQYRHIVDWCGCSPNDIKISDIERLLHYETKPVFFARKFEAIVDQEVINTLDRNFHGFLYPGLSSLSSYWQNAYHHLDKDTKVRDADLTIYSSVIRQAMDQLAESDPSCTLKPEKVLEAHIYNQADHFHGLLVLSSVLLKETNMSTMLEVHVEQKHYYTVVDAKASSGRLLSLEVGSDFDMKEQIFRNYGSLLGPYDDISLRHEWSPGTELTVSIAWVDPTNEIAASYDIVIPNEHHIGTQKPVLFRPLRPGIWKACFLITPLTFFNNKPISTAEILRSHKGPLGLYTSTNFTEFMTYLKLTESPQLRLEAFNNSRRTGADLNLWVDSLTRLFWVVRQMCIVNSTATCSSLKECHASPWSSQSPDLKSDMRYIGSKIPVIS
ncbi:unnamed protein product, partial [Candidula unifasciata]